MKVIKRYQISEIKIKRVVSHLIEIDGIRYIRYEEKSMYVPYMDFWDDGCKSSIKWDKYISKNVVEKLNSRGVRELGLEKKFSELDIDSRNGNN